MRKRWILSFSVLAIFIFFGIVGYISLPNYFFKVGMSYYKKGNYQEAYNHIKKSLLIDSNNTEFRYYYVLSLAKLKPSYDVQKEMFEFANDDKKDSAHLTAGIQVNLWRNNLIQLYGANYIDKAPLNSDIIRWNPKTFPLKVYISSKGTNTYPEYYSTEVVRAFSQWTASSGFVSFKIADKEANSQIVVHYKNSPATSCEGANCKYIVAHTDPVIKGGLLKKMIITIYDRDANGSFFSDKELYSTVLHEIGHALGIMGHSYSTDDLMYMSNQVNSDSNRLFIKHRSAFQYISLKDISTLKLLYNIVPTISNTHISEFNTKNLIYAPIMLGTAKEMSSQHLKEAQAYVEQAPNLPAGYIDMAIAYDELGQFDKALDAFQKAYNLAKENNDKFIVMYNISVMYLNNNKPESALNYAKQAQKIDDNEDIQELLGNIDHALNTKTKPFWMNKKTK